MSLNPGARSVTGRIALVCGAITAGAGMLILVGWTLGWDALTAMGTDYIPMAPNTASLFVLLGSAVLGRELWPASRGIHLAAATAALLSAVAAGVTLIGLNIDESLFHTTRMLGAMPIGRMSPVSAFCFVLAGASLLLLESQARTWAAIAGSLITLVGAVCLMGYGFGAPLLYGGTVIPVALPTSLALVALGVALTAAAGPKTWPLNTLIGSSTRARLLRALLPTVVILALIDDWIHSRLLERMDPGVVLASATTAISFLLVVSLVISRVSRTIGDAIDRTRAERDQAEMKVAALTADLEDKVASRTRELAIALEAATESDRLKTEFMANVTHELRTPLNSVIGFAELLKDEVPGPLNAQQAEFASDILASGQHLLALVEGILEMSRLDAAGAALEREPVDIGAALEERMAAHRKASEALGLTTRLELAADTGRAELDRKALRHMLDALLDNAVKFNRAGGTVTVRARRAGGVLEIAVTDTGIGIAQDDLAKLFKPFAQLDAGLARRHGGVGLGLALARRMAQLHGGTIEVASEPGKGSTFTLRLPIQEKS